MLFEYFWLVAVVLVHLLSGTLNMPLRLKPLPCTSVSFTEFVLLHPFRLRPWFFQRQLFFFFFLQIMFKLGNNLTNSPVWEDLQILALLLFSPWLVCENSKRKFLILKTVSLHVCYQHDCHIYHFTITSEQLHKINLQTYQNLSQPYGKPSRFSMKLFHLCS